MTSAHDRANPLGSGAGSTLRVDYHQFWIRGLLPPPLVPLLGNGLVDAGETAAMINTGISMGPVGVTLEQYQAEPAAELTGWDDVVEISLRADTEDLLLCSLMSGPADLPVVARIGSVVRVRVCALNRDHNIDGVDREATERYLVAVWPAAGSPPVVLRQTDGYGAEVRRSQARKLSISSTPQARRNGRSGSPPLVKSAPRTSPPSRI